MKKNPRVNVTIITQIVFVVMVMIVLMSTDDKLVAFPIVGILAILCIFIGNIVSSQFEMKLSRQEEGKIILKKSLTNSSVVELKGQSVESRFIQEQLDISNGHIEAEIIGEDKIKVTLWLGQHSYISKDVTFKEFNKAFIVSNKE